MDNTVFFNAWSVCVDRCLLTRLSSRASCDAFAHSTHTYPLISPPCPFRDFDNSPRRKVGVRSDSLDANALAESEWAAGT